MCDISIIVPVYNHEKYIEQAIQSILMQKVKLSYEVLIGEDCSTDKSREVLKKIEPNLPKNFHIYYRNHNFGAKKNINDLYSKMKGRYFIVLEGDDFWNYEYKLQKQYDFLENNKDYIAVAHRTQVVGKSGEKLNFEYPECHHNIYREIDFLNGKMAGQTATILCRNYISLKLFDFNVNVGEYKAGDRVKLFLLYSHGKIKCIQKKWSSYRYVLAGGSSYCATHIYKKDEFIPYYRGIYKYCVSHKDIDIKITKTIEKVYLWELFKLSIRKKSYDYKNEFITIFKKSNNKSGAIMYCFYKCVKYPVTLIESYKMKKQNLKIIKKQKEEKL